MRRIMTVNVLKDPSRDCVKRTTIPTESYYVVYRSKFENEADIVHKI